MRTKHPQQYMDAVKAGTHLADSRTLTRVDLPFEFMMNALRLNEGVPAALFDERTGLPLMVCAAALEQARTRGLLARDGTRLQPTLQGQRFLNDLLAVFLPE
jgi:oxygen-independent coproporphyrinogen-3 oxidase